MNISPNQILEDSPVDVWGEDWGAVGHMPSLKNSPSGIDIENLSMWEFSEKNAQSETVLPPRRDPLPEGEVDFRPHFQLADVDDSTLSKVPREEAWLLWESKVMKSQAEAVLPPRREPRTEGDVDFRPQVELADVESLDVNNALRKKIPRKEMAFMAASTKFFSIEDREWMKSKASKAGLTIAVGALAIPLIISIFIFLQQEGAERGAVVSGRDDGGMSAIEQAINAEFEQLLERKDEARKLFADFAQAQVVEEILPMVRNGASREELIRQNGHRRLADREWLPSSGSKWSIDLIGGQPYAHLIGELPDFRTFQAYFVLEDNDLVLDWKATTGYATASFDELAKGEGDGTEVRGHIRPSNLYTTVWPEGEYRSYQLESPDGTGMVWCYVRRGTTTDDVLFKIFQNEGIVERKKRDDAPVTVKLIQGKVGGLPNQWLIEDLHHLDWIEVKRKGV